MNIGVFKIEHTPNLILNIVVTEIEQGKLNLEQGVGAHPEKKRALRASFFPSFEMSVVPVVVAVDAPVVRNQENKKRRPDGQMCEAPDCNEFFSSNWYAQNR